MRHAQRCLGAAGVFLLFLSGCGDSVLTGNDDLRVPLYDLSVPTVDLSVPDLTENGCVTSAQCDGGVCVGGQCCPSAADACGTSCCTGGTVCLFDRCVLPGLPCHTAGDCAPGEYCETSLGSQGGDGGVPGDGGTGGDGGSPGDGGATCTQPIPLTGRCLPLPPRCEADGGMPPDGGSCIPACEYRLPPGGPLDAVQRWTWTQANAQHRPNFTDVWATPAVGRIHDSNCDGKVDELDPPVVVFVSGRALDAANNNIGTCCQCSNTVPTACHTGVLRMLDGRSGREIWSLNTPEASSSGFAGLSVALGDIDGDARTDILAVSGEGYVFLVDADGNVQRKSDLPIPGAASNTFGWGGGLAVADMDGDGHPEIAYARTVYTTNNNAITLKFTGTGGIGGSTNNDALSTFVDLDLAPGGNLELLAGRTAYKFDGTTLWDRSVTAPVIPDGFPGIGDFDLDGTPEVVLINNDQIYILAGATGATRLGPFVLPGNGFGGPPTVADFDGDGAKEIGVAQQNRYTVVRPDLAGMAIVQVWSTPNHDLSSSVTGSTVFDFEGDGAAEVIYADECFLWVFDGRTGGVRFSAPTTSFTATEASLVADVDGDGRAEIVMVSNSADPSAAGWGCMNASGTPVTVNNVTWTRGPNVGSSYRGVTVFGDRASGWVGSRTLWNQHTYHVSNICDHRDSACGPPNVYGSIPAREQPNWTLPWLNNFRQNVQDKGLFDAPDATLTLTVDCFDPIVAHPTVRNLGLASLPAGVEVAVYKVAGAGDVELGRALTTRALLPGQFQQLDVTVMPGAAATTDNFYARILIDPQNPTFRQCRDDNDATLPLRPDCLQ